MMILRAFFLFFIATAVAAQEPPRVVVSIAPIHSLVANVMAGVAEPELLIKGNASPHAFMLKPSQRRALQRADLVVWVDEGVESFLFKALRGRDKNTVKLTSLKALTLLPTRQGGLWTAADRHHHEHSRTDGHLWLDPDNAKVIAIKVTAVLSELSPAYAQQYQRNRDVLLREIEALDARLKQRLNAVKEAPYLVFHDAYQYFEAHYGLNAMGAITVDPERKPGARRLQQLRKKLTANKVQCIFTEPQFSDATARVITEGSQVKIAQLDPMGLGLTEGPRLYFDLMHALADSLNQCLTPRSAQSSL